MLKDCVLDDRDGEINESIFEDPETAVEYLDVFLGNEGSSSDITVSDQHEFYRYRSEEALYLSYYEYIAICSVVPMKARKQQDVVDVVENVGEDDEDEDANVEGDVVEEEVIEGLMSSPSSVRVSNAKRPENLTLRLHRRHPLYDTHVEKVRSKQVLPVISRRIPRLASLESQEDSDLKDNIALFYLTLFCPIDPNSGLFIATWSESRSGGGY